MGSIVRKVMGWGMKRVLIPARGARKSKAIYLLRMWGVPG
jgi:hypothetical protein